MKKAAQNDAADFAYEISDERLLAYSALPIIDRLRWLDEIRQFTLAVRAAPEAVAQRRSRTEQEPGATCSPPPLKEGSPVAVGQHHLGE